MPLAVTWVVVAESSRARILRLEGLQSPLCELDDLVNPDARAHEQDLISDRPGRTFDSSGQGRHAKQAPASHKQQRSADFARVLAERMEHGLAQGEFEEIILIAAPEFLGLLRQHLSEATKQHVKREIHKNIVRESEETIRGYLKL